MARKPPSASDELATLRQKVSAERVRHGGAQVAEEAARAAVQRTTDAITVAYASDSPSAVAAARKAQAEAVAAADDLRHQLAAADLRLDRARSDLANFMAERGRDLIEERAPDARHAADHLVDCVRVTVRALRAYRDFRTETDSLVAGVPNAVVRVDGAPATFDWEDALRNLDRVVREHPEPPPPPMPQCTGCASRSSRTQPRCIFATSATLNERSVSNGEVRHAEGRTTPELGHQREASRLSLGRFNVR